MLKWMRILLIVAPAIAALVAIAHADERIPPCEASKETAGSCFVVHGRIASFYQGAWPVKIWVVGTHRMLGVVDVDQFKAKRDFPTLPDNVQRLLGDDPVRTYVVYGDFKVCPLGKERRGWMRFVCLQRGTHLVRMPAQ